MKYGPASKFSVNRPSTNVPLNCPMCQTDEKGRRKTFWKYNFMEHILDYHLSELNELPMLPLELMVTTHISKKEETQIGIPSSRTDEYRDSHNILDSEGIAVIIEEEGDSSDDEGEGNGDETVHVVIRESPQYEDRQSRKRGLSSVSVASFTSAKRDESPTKKHQGSAE
jgi:hypothetical protein